MSSGTSQITLSTPRPTKNSVTVLATAQTVYETGQIVVYDSSSIEVARSATRTVPSQSSLDIDVYGLLPGNEYTAKFYNEDNMDFSSSTVDFTTLEDDKFYGGVSGTGPVAGVTGEIRSGATNVTAFDAEAFWTAAEEDIDADKRVSYLRVYITGKSSLSGNLRLYYTDGTAQYLLFSPSSVPDFSSYGITLSSQSAETADYIDLAPIYGSGAKQIIDLYGGRSNQAKKITKLYGQSSETGYLVTAVSPSVVDINALNSMYYMTYGPFTFSPRSITKHEDNYTGLTRVFIKDYAASNIIELFRYTTGAYDNEGRVWGFSSEPVTLPPERNELVANITSSSSQQPLAKLIHQGFGHNRYFGQVKYYTSSSHTTTRTVTIENQQQLDSLGAYSVPWTAEIGGVTVVNTDIKEVELFEDATSIPNFFLKGATALDKIDITKSKITNMRDSFLRDCTSFNSPVVLPETVTGISGNFMHGCTAFNSAVTLPSGITSLGTAFLNGCSLYNQPLILPSSLAAISNYFLEDCASFNQQLSIPNSVTSIGESFLRECVSFNQPIVLPNSITQIGSNFLRGSYSFNQDLTLPTSLTSLGSSFLYIDVDTAGTGSMTGTVNVGSLPTSITKYADTFILSCKSSTAPMYATGVKIAGANRAEWLSKFPNNNLSYYRKLLDAGY